MSNSAKNISLPALTRRVVRIAGLDEERDFRVYDLEPEWRPLPRDIQISVQRKLAPEANRNFIQFHQRFVLKLHLAGESEGFVEEKFFHFRPGEGILVFPFQLHRITRVSTPGGQLRVLANFTLSAEDQALLAPLCDRVFTLDDELRSEIGELVRSSASADAADRQKAIVRLSFVLAALRKTALQTPQRPPAAAPPSPSTTGDGGNAGAPLFAYIRDHCREGVSIKELAQRFGISEGSVRRAFLRETGKAPGMAIRELRLKNAAELLRTTEQSIRQIGERCGFASPFSFSRAFRNRFGLSPRAFRSGGEAAEKPEAEKTPPKRRSRGISDGV